MVIEIGVEELGQPNAGGIKGEGGLQEKSIGE